jgi:hypothetical protein
VIAFMCAWLVLLVIGAFVQFKFKNVTKSMKLAVAEDPLISYQDQEKREEPLNNSNEV